MLNTKEIITQSNIKFGTSGLRGLVSDLSPEVCASFVHAFISTLENKYIFKTVAIGMDNRPSSPDIASYCCDTLLQLGLTPIFFDVLPTPALASYCLEMKIPGLMITGSHIPFDRNGIKYYRPDGEIDKIDEHVIMNVSFDFKPPVFSGELPQKNHDAEKMYMDRYISFYPKTLLLGKKIGIYEHSSAGRDLYPKIFSSLGAEVIQLGRSDSFVPIDTEAVSKEDCIKAKDWTQKYALDAIYSTDGDGDRPLLADNNGNWLRGDILGLICSQALGIKAIVTPINCNSMIDNASGIDFVERTKIGSPYVLEGISALRDKFGTIAGFEANGGYILSTPVYLNGKILNALPTRDALLPVLSVLAQCKGRDMSEIVSLLPSIYTASDRIQNFPNKLSMAFLDGLAANPKIFFEQLGINLSIKDINLLDGVRITFINGSVIHLRASGNAPELRCYCESDKLVDAEEMVNLVLTNILAFTA